ncbi:MAG: chorismate synthase [Desulfovibrionaceae bacterium]|nr:chorismate synthase [Desulfovibrionaceae bacterium]
MSSNSFGLFFRYTSWGESHGQAVGVIVDGCPAGIPLDEEMLNEALARRAPGQNFFTSPRREGDQGRLLSGVFEGRTTGSPISILIANHDARSSAYEAIASLLRPGHANFTYLAKYGCFDYRGGGRASARETVARVAAGVVARQFAVKTGIRVLAYLGELGTSQAAPAEDLETAAAYALQSPVHAPDASSETAFMEELRLVMEEKDSTGGVAHFHILNAPVGLGDPVYEKFHARLAYALMSIPASKGFEIGAGFAAAAGRGSRLNDSFGLREGVVVPAGNNAGGVLGGITTGETIYGRVAFKPASSIGLPQNTLDLQGKPATFQLPDGSRHDPCVAVRAVPVVEAMCWLVLADALLMQRAVASQNPRPAAALPFAGDWL